MGIGLVGPKYWYSCGAEYMLGLMGLVGEWIPKSMLARLLKLDEWWLVLVEPLVVEADAFESFRVVVVLDGDLAMGNDMPRSFPRLATPTPQVRVVRYPVQSLPISTHCPQYGRLRSHLTERFLQEKQSSVAPVAGALLLLFLGAAAALLLSSTFLTSMGWVVVGEATAMLGDMSSGGSGRYKC
jgi:hypothetical protein